MSLSFDATYYQTTRPDVFNAFVQTQGSTGLTWAQFAENHYNTFGWLEGSNPTASFDTSFYLSTYTDVAAAGVNPFQHFISFGSLEMRQPFSTFPTSSFVAADYAAANPDLAAAGITTDAALYQHFVIFGQFESRPGAPTVETPNTGSTFTLTINQDNLTGTSGNDTFNAVATQDGNGTLIDTLQNVDVLDGGAGTDSLNVTLAGAAVVAPSMTGIENANVRFASAATLDLSNSTGVEAINIANSTSAGTVTSVGAASSISVSNQKQNASFDGQTATTLALVLDTFGTTAAANTIDLGTVAAAKATTLNATMTNSNAVVDSTVADAITTLSVAATGTNGLSLVDSGDDVTSATITGTGTLNLSATALTGALTTFDASGNSGGVTVDIQSTKAVTATGGSGADVFDMDTAVIADTTVDLGAGNDALYTGALLSNFKSANGGDGTDIINITNGAQLTAANAAKISNFETLDVSGGTGTYDLSLEAFDTVQINEAIGGALAGVTNLTNAAAGFTLNVASKAETDANFALGSAQSIALKDATGSSDTVNISVAINDGNNDSAADGNVTFSTSTTIAAVENINIASSVATADTGVAASKYTTTFTDLIAANVQTLTLTGDSSIVFTALTNAGNTLTKVDASGSTGDITLDASAITTSVTYTGSAGVDTYSATDGGSIYAAAGNDQVTLAAAGNADTIILQSAADTTMTDADNNGNIDAFTEEAYATFTTDASAGGNSADTVDVTTLGFTGFAAGALNKGALANAVGSGNFSASITDFFADAGGDRGVAYGTNGGNSYVFVDANKDGNFTAADDIVIELTAVTDLANTDFAF